MGTSRLPPSLHSGRLRVHVRASPRACACACTALRAPSPHPHPAAFAMAVLNPPSACRRRWPASHCVLRLPSLKQGCALSQPT
eukprot:2084559-Pleurochrysis_carterae.AAC.1